MGQYHKLVSMDASEYLDPHDLGCGLKAWEQTGGGIPAVFAFLLAAEPGNMPADMGQHPMAGRWAGHRMLVVGDYAENNDIRRFDGPPLSRLYSLCKDAPKLEDFKPYQTTKRMRTGAERYVTVAPEKQLAAALRDLKKTTANGKYALFPNLSPTLRGALEYALSVRFCGDGWCDSVPVKAFAERGPDGHLHYRLDKLRMEKPHLSDDTPEDLLLRRTSLGGWDNSPKLNPHTWLMPNGERWPWDRAPADLSWHDATDADQDAGQERVYACLDRREFVNPRAFGEVPTTLGIMRAAQWDSPRMAMDMLITASGMQSNVRSGTPDMGSAAAVFAMLLHPETRGGGDIAAGEFPEIGRWRNTRLVLTAERSRDGALPTTDEVRASFRDISTEVLRAACGVAASEAA